MSAIKIEEWVVVLWPTDTHCSPERRTTHLSGKVQNHPGCAAGKIVTTSSIVGRRGNLVITKSGHTYELGRIRTEYEAQFPDATERLLKTLPEI